MSFVKVYSLPFCSRTTVTVMVVIRAAVGVYWKVTLLVLLASRVPAVVSSPMTSPPTV